MLLDILVVAVLLIVGNVAFRHFEPRMPLWKRAAKIVVILAVTTVISRYFGRTGVLIAIAVALIPVLYIHGYWLPRRGVNGWTGEPRDKYYALRGWPPPEG